MQPHQETSGPAGPHRPPLPVQAVIPGQPGSAPESYRVLFTRQGIEIGGKLTTLKDADEFIAVINSLKVLLRPILPSELNVGQDENS